MAERSLILVRHAKAAWPSSGQPDFERELTDEGRRDAQRMGEWLEHKGVAMDTMVTSAAPRAQATGALLAAARGSVVPLLSEEKLYEASVHGLSSVIRGFDDRWLSPWLVGHNPGLSHFADWLLGEPTVLELAPCAVVWLAVPLDHWRGLEPGCATLRGRWSSLDLGEPG